MAIHQVDSICPICSKVSVFGKCDMTGHDKYLCPGCGGRHYGAPEYAESKAFYVCGRCNEPFAKELWRVVPLEEGEHVLGPIQGCSSCEEKLKEGYIALIEVDKPDGGEDDRTGKVVFAVPPESFRKEIGDNRAIYVEKAVLEKLMKNRS